MSDSIDVITSSAEIAEGSGYLVAVVLSSSTGTPLATFYDNTAGSGDKIFEIYVPTGAPQQVFFPARSQPKFNTGLYAALGSNLTVTIWTRQYSLSS
jgi:hypothetical protein